MTASRTHVSRDAGDRVDMTNDLRDRPRRRLSTETKAAFKTTELWVYLLAVTGVLLASFLVDSNGDRGDYFRADQAWLYIVVLTIGYLGSRGLAKSGSRDFYDDAR